MSCISTTSVPVSPSSDWASSEGPSVTDFTVQPHSLLSVIYCNNTHPERSVKTAGGGSRMKRSLANIAWTPPMGLPGGCERPAGRLRPRGGRGCADAETSLAVTPYQGSASASQHPPLPRSHHEVIEHACVSSTTARDCQIACLVVITLLLRRGPPR